MDDMPSEKIVEKYLVKRCKELNLHTVKVPATSTGFPDRLVIGTNITLYIEVKGGGGRLSAAQKLWLARLREKNHYALTVWNEEDVDNALALF